MREIFKIELFKPLFLTVENIGPFQGRVYTVDFTTAEDQPCNFFLLVAENGRGKTTLLETMADLMSLLSVKRWPVEKDINICGPFRQEGLRLGYGRAQMDFLVKFQKDEINETVIFSLAIDKKRLFWIKNWSPDEIQRYGATSHAKIGLERFMLDIWCGDSNDKANMLSRFIDGTINPLPGNFDIHSLTAPTTLHFPDSRDIPLLVVPGDRSICKPENWEYQPVKRFGSDPEWNRSPDNVLVWLQWLDEERLTHVQQMINDWVFANTQKRLEGVRRDPPEAIVNNNGVKHRLDSLSGGERNLVQLCLRLGIHITSNTLVLIDEVDLHLHVKWQHRILNLLKNLVRDNPGMTVIATTHSSEIIAAFAEDLKEPGLRKGGQIIDMESND